jgi:AcrR family transcriptional regulator
MSSYDTTHRKIIDSAKKCFFEKGFKGSNLREICKGAGVTTGAFYRHFSDKEEIYNVIVNPAIEEYHLLYNDMEEEYYSALNDEDLKRVWDMHEDSLLPIIEIIYKHFDAFQLILLSSEGTEFSQFVHQCAERETQCTVDYIKEMKKRGFHVKDVSEDELHMLIQAYYASIFEIVMHRYDKEKAIEYSRTLVKFFKPGWQQLFGF